MITAQLLAALVITVAPAGLWLHRMLPGQLSPQAPSARWLLLGGYSILLGMLLTSLLMRLLSLLGIPFSLYSLAGAALILCVAAWLLPPAARGQQSAATAAAEVEPGRWQRYVVVLCLALLALRLLSLGLEVSTRPVTSWDAKQHWAKQARVFFELRSVVPYVSLQEWLQLGGQGVYTNMHPDYPITTPLLQAWTAVAIGHWHASLVNLPWLLTWLATGMVFYGQARLAGAGTALAIGATYMLLSMPYLNIHVALAGYADLLLGCCYLAAVAALYNWSVSREHWQLLLALSCGAACILIKNEGFYWALSLLPGILLVLIGFRKGVIWLAALALLVVATIWLIPEDMVIAGHSLASIDIRYRPQSWLPLYLSFLVHDNWHFLAYLALAALAAVPFCARQALPLAAVMVSALLLYMTLYLFTSNAVGAEHFTSLNRVALQLMPAAGFFTLAIFATLVQRDLRK